jgi:hypothetical protein
MTSLRQSCAVVCGNFMVCDLWTDHENLQICRLAHPIAELAQEFADLRFTDF